MFLNVKGDCDITEFRCFLKRMCVYQPAGPSKLYYPLPFLYMPPPQPLLLNRTYAQENLYMPYIPLTYLSEAFVTRNK